ncbi:peptidylprolyl isomerase [Bradyrhizobium sp. ARR65]|uniref:peptidylprolyl isomerase n=1 Tax=Bradyrhizobium sp. ARR65 TaxID=1040989 RepID=UPI0004658557|nr:peptidylprolyl isomerase [Bradyrhizobium sp. ARR65]
MSDASILKLTRPAGIAVVTAMICCSTLAAPAQTPAPAAPRAASVPAKPRQAVAAPAQNAPAAAPATATQGLAAGKIAGNEDVVARVGNTNISAADVRSYVAALAPREQAALEKDPALLSQAVRLLLTNRLVLQEAQEKKWDQQPAVAAQLDRIREGALVELYLQSITVPPANFPSDEEVQKVYDANRAAMLAPRQFQLAQIFVAVPKDADKATDDKAKQQIDEIARKLKAPGADFAAIASASNEAKDSGDLGWLAETQIRPEIRNQVMGLAKNAVSEPIKLDDGWHILKLIDTKASYTRTLPEVRDQLVQQMRAERSAMLRRAYLAELQKQHPPVLNELALSGLFDNSKK